MLGTAALSELPISAVGSAGSQGSVAIAVCTAVGQGSVSIGRSGTVVAAVVARASARIDRDSTRVGFACGSSSVFAVGRAEHGAIAATARTRVLPQPKASSQALSPLTSVLTAVRDNPHVSSLALPLVVTATTVVRPLVVASSRPDDVD
jgi:hypothetical protein